MAKYGEPGPVQVRCAAAQTLDWKELYELQGGIKVHDAEWIAQSIAKNGFITPFFVWYHGKTNYCLDGHGRLRGLRLLEKDGWQIPPLPVVYLDFPDECAAKRAILLINNLPYKYDQKELKSYIKELRQIVQDNQGDLDFGDLNLYQVNSKDLLEEYEQFVRPDFTDDSHNKGSSKNNQYFYVEYYGDAEKYLLLERLFTDTGLLKGKGLDAERFYHIMKGALSSEPTQAAQ